jgi:hypothetical protein
VQGIKSYGWANAFAQKMKVALICFEKVKNS